MNRSKDRAENKAAVDGVSAPGLDSVKARKANHLKDEVYREMFLLEAGKPGAEMGLALAFLRAYVEAESLDSTDEIREWLKTISPIGLRMIETALRGDSVCKPKPV